MKYLSFQILGFALMILGTQGVIALLVSSNAGLLSWLDIDTSLLVAIYVIVDLCGVYLLSWSQKQSKRAKKS